jgi:hypothetical protein
VLILYLFLIKVLIFILFYRHAVDDNSMISSGGGGYADLSASGFGGLQTMGVSGSDALYYSSPGSQDGQSPPPGMFVCVCVYFKNTFHFFIIYYYYLFYRNGTRVGHSTGGYTWSTCTT